MSTFGFFPLLTPRTLTHSWAISALRQVPEICVEMLHREVGYYGAMKFEGNLPTRPAEGALQVYLDSSDYSVLSEAMCDSNHPDIEVLRKLCREVDHGRIEIRFSSIHVIEITHLDSRSREFALRRAKCLQRLSGGKCFKFWLDMPVIECVNILSKRPIYEGIINNNGLWHPDFSDVALSLKQVLIDEFRTMLIDSTINRHQRRTLERRYFPNGHLSKEAISLLKQNEREELLAVVAREFPLSEKFYQDDLMLQFAAGNTSAAEVVDEMGVIFRDVEKFIGWTYDTRDTERKLVTWLRDYGRNLASTVKILRETLNVVNSNRDSMFDNGIDIPSILEAKIPELRLSRLMDVQTQTEARYPKSRYSNSDWEAIRNSALGSIPSLDGFVLSFAEHFRRNLLMNRKPKTSDAGDLFHLTHLPYCDLFRADGDAAETAKPVASTYNTRVVSKLRDLPQEIDEALS